MKSAAKIQAQKAFILSEMMRSHALYELAAADKYFSAYKALSGKNVTSAVLKKCLHQAEEEMEHFILIQTLHEKHFGSLDKIVTDRLAKLQLPTIETLESFYAASWIFDRAGILQLLSMKDCSWKPYRALVKKIILDEKEHFTSGKKAFLQASRLKEIRSQDLKQQAELWLRTSLSCFGSSESFGDKWAIQLKLKNQSAANLKKNLETEVLTVLQKISN